MKSDIAEVFNNGSLVTRVILPCNGVEIAFIEGLHNVEVVVYDIVGNKGSIAIMILVQHPETTIETGTSSPGFTLLFSVLSLIVIIISFRKNNLRRRYDS